MGVIYPSREMSISIHVFNEDTRNSQQLALVVAVETLETQLTSSEVFTALFELEMAGRIRQLPGKNYVRTMG